ncbi:ABC transporter ATP-binding protein [Paenibacillus radicis (ex Gao et al. 2016)]|uniref:Multidrug ABC transporter ATP-binding protein n=1 Tax=Paenibacillus radicis (ex Gao et al. 2016) TaxID=1737354 RepID=A0A917M726_9BACL|nr:ABC transporter ATP-binding protein [Paenibacillus radicis (ex Gao et al. 2016)]GGG81568.1 multidrug ABC transporter ATP-binding protein [Paenibacillus radicis (ex Gao et al. 2016)]
MTSTAIETKQLTKDYGDGRGIRGVSLHIEAGEAFGFLGPNGAGKSTLVKMLVGLIKPTSGEARIFGMAAGSVEARRRIGYLPELFRYPGWLSGEEALHFHAQLCGLDRVMAKQRIHSLLDEVGIGSRGRDRIKGYSKGMQQRLGLACALLADPDIVFLDEPASALDPVGRYEVRELLIRLRGRGKTIFLNSHLLEDVEQMCDRIALLNNGSILSNGSLNDVLHSRNKWLLKVGGFTPFVLDWLSESTGLSVTVVTESDAEAEELLEEGVVWLETAVENEEQIGLLHFRLIEQGLTLYESKKASSRLDQWFLKSVSGLDHRGERR